MGYNVNLSTGPSKTKGNSLNLTIEGDTSFIEYCTKSIKPVDVFNLKKMDILVIIYL